MPYVSILDDLLVEENDGVSFVDDELQDGQQVVALPMPPLFIPRRVLVDVQSGRQLVDVPVPSRDRIRLRRMVRFASRAQYDEYQTLAALPSRTEEPGEDGRRAHVPGSGHGVQVRPRDGVFFLLARSEGGKVASGLAPRLGMEGERRAVAEWHGAQDFVLKKNIAKKCPWTFSGVVADKTT